MQSTDQPGYSTLQENYARIVDSTLDPEGTTDHLFTKYLISKATANKVRAERLEDRQRRLFLDAVMSQGRPGAFQTFVEIVLKDSELWLGKELKGSVIVSSGVIVQRSWWLHVFHSYRCLHQKRRDMGWKESTTNSTSSTTSTDAWWGFYWRTANYLVYSTPSLIRSGAWEWEDLVLCVPTHRLFTRLFRSDQPMLELHSQLQVKILCQWWLEIVLSVLF